MLRNKYSHRERYIIASTEEETINLSSSIEVDDIEIIPRIKIYCGVEKDSYYFRKIGFRSSITEE